MAASETRELLRSADGFVVESPDGDLGWVEEVWIGDRSEAQALAVRTVDGRHGLLLGEDVVAVDRENHWVVVPADPTLLELEPPHLTERPDDGEAQWAASWRTTGRRLTPVPRRPRLLRYLHRYTRRRRRGTPHETPLWRAVATLITGVILAVVLVITLAFLIADLVTGTPY